MYIRQSRFRQSRSHPGFLRSAWSFGMVARLLAVPARPRATVARFLPKVARGPLRLARLLRNTHVGPDKPCGRPPGPLAPDWPTKSRSRGRPCSPTDRSRERWPLIGPRFLGRALRRAHARAGSAMSFSLPSHWSSREPAIPPDSRGPRVRRFRPNPGSRSVPAPGARIEPDSVSIRFVGLVLHG